MNTLPKYVVFGSLAEAEWSPTTVLPGDPVVTVAQLSRRPGRELQIHGSSWFGAALLAVGLVDTVRPPSRPRYCGRVGGCSSAAGLRLTRHEATPLGLLLLEYETTGPAPLAEFDGVAQFA
ncbi:hypothetical protein AB0M34_03275 [Nocardia sp. NPDC050193]